MDEEYIFDSDGSVDVEAMREERETRKVPPNPPPQAAQNGWLDGKAIAGIAVSVCINCKTWINQAVMEYLIESANRKNGACYPSNATIAKHLRCDQRTVKRATRWWRSRGYKGVPFLKIAMKGRQKFDGTKESNAYHISWLTLIAVVAKYHYRKRVRRHAAAILQQHSAGTAPDKLCQNQGTNSVKAGGQTCPPNLLIGTSVTKWCI
jgi:Helix-turn-helix domain